MKAEYLKLDRWISWPSIGSLMAVTSLALVCGLPGIVSFILIPLCFICLPVAIIAIGGFAAYLLVKQRPRKAISLSVAMLLPLLLLTPINWVADCIHLGMTAWFGLGQLADTARPTGDGLEVFDWSVGLAGGPSTFLIRDPADQLALSKSQIQHLNDPTGFLRECAGNAEHLIGHYYVCVVG